MEVVYLTKEQAVAQANYNLSSFRLRERFKTALKREEKLHELWEETSKALAQQKELTQKVEKQLALREEELIDVQKFHRKEKRKKFIQNTGLGIVIGIVGTLVLIK
jgi:hypothetical protein